MTLVALLIRHPDEVVVDFWRYYGQGIDQLGASIEDVAAMAVHLPRDSATMLAVSPRHPAEGWTQDTHLLARVADLLAGGNWQRGGGKGPRPKPIEPPKLGPAEPIPDREAIDEFRQWYASQPGGRPLNN